MSTEQSSKNVSNSDGSPSSKTESSESSDVGTSHVICGPNLPNYGDTSNYNSDSSSIQSNKDHTEVKCGCRMGQQLRAQLSESYNTETSSTPQTRDCYPQPKLKPCKQNEKEKRRTSKERKKQTKKKEKRRKQKNIEICYNPDYDNYYHQNSESKPQRRRSGSDSCDTCLTSSCSSGEEEEEPEDCDSTSKKSHTETPKHKSRY